MKGFFQHITFKYDRETCRAMKEYCNEVKRYAQKQQGLKFLLSCRRFGIVPKHTMATTAQVTKLFQCATIKEHLERVEYNFHRKILNLEISQTNADLRAIKRKLYNLKSGIRNFLTIDDFGAFMKNQTDRNRYINMNARHKQTSKLNTLKEKLFMKLGLVFNEQWLENKTEVDIPWECKWLLSLGKKFALPINRQGFSPLEIIADVEQCIQKMVENTHGEKDETRTRVANRITLFKRNIRNTPKEKLILAIYEKTKKFLKRHKDIIILQSDKGNKTVAIYKKEYERKMEKLLEDKNTYQVMNTDPTNKLVRTNNNIISQLYRDKYMDNWQKHRLTCSAATAPRIYGLPKIHKCGIPLRPIVSSIQVPCYQLSKHIGLILKNIISNKYNVKNSLELKKQLKDITLDENDTLVSFDVVSLFTNVPVYTAIKNIMDQWNTIETKTSIPKSKFLEILKFCLNDNNYFTYNNKIYKQIFGMPMGNPLSPTIADIVLDNLLDAALTELHNKNVNIKYVAKYVDDILAVIDINDKDVILKALNGYHPKIKFTVEVETNREIAYLDTKLHRGGNKITFDWYAKNTSSGRIINFNATQPKAQIINTAKNFIRRVLDISDEQYHNKNKLVITKILKDNAFPTNLIKNLITVYKPTITNTNGNTDKEEKYFYSVKYIPGLTDNKNIRSAIDKNDMSFAYKPNKTLSAIFTNTKTPINKLQQNNVVYEIPCKGDNNNSCDLVYIGTTKRNLETRMGEHNSDINKNKESTALSQHILQTKHKPDFDNIRILDKVNNVRKRYTTESLRIQQKINKTMNKKEDTDNLSACYRVVLKNSR